VRVRADRGFRGHVPLLAAALALACISEFADTQLATTNPREGDGHVYGNFHFNETTLLTAGAMLSGEAVRHV